MLFTEAHRTMFFFGALQALLGMAWWVLDLGARLGLYAPIVWMLPPMWAHAWLLLYALFPFFMFGFLMTAGPNWLGAPKMPRIAFVPAALMMAGGIVLFYAGLVAGRPLAAAGAFLHAAGWLWGIAALVRVLVRHWNPNARYAMVIFGFLSLGLAGDVTFALGIATADYTHVHYVLHGAVWFFLLPVFLGVSTRMVPFFSSGVLGPGADYRPAWARPALIAGAVFHGALDLSGLHAWLWLVDLPLSALVARLTWRWGLPKSGGERLLAVLHISLAVLALALLVSAGASLAVLLGAATRVNLAPLHLLVIGYFAAMMLGMVSRVSLGHSGRPLEADALTWGCYLGVLLAAALRFSAEYWLGTPVGRALMLAAAAAWLAAFGVWAWRYVPMYVRPRVDARTRIAKA
jgi:uncharacterized protein involved in response to NO